MIRGAGGIGDAPLIGARRIRSVLIVFLFASLLVRATILGALCEGWDCEKQYRSGQQHCAVLHSALLKSVNQSRVSLFRAGWVLIFTIIATRQRGFSGAWTMPRFGELEEHAWKSTDDPTLLFIRTQVCAFLRQR